jgi:hypothetical protein
MPKHRTKNVDMAHGSKIPHLPIAQVDTNGRAIAQAVSRRLMFK